MNTSRSYGRRITSGIALGTAGLVTAGLIAAAPVRDISPLDRPAAQLDAFHLVAATSTVAVPSASLAITSSDLESEINAAADYVPSIWLQQAYFLVGIGLGVAAASVLSFAEGLPAPLRDAGQAVVQFVVSAVKTAFDALFVIDKQIQGFFGGFVKPQAARHSAPSTGHPVSRRAVPTAPQRTSVRKAARTSALSSAAKPARQAGHPGTTRESRRGRG